MISSITTPSAIQFAFDEAREAQPSWAATPMRERLQCIRRIRHLLAQRCIDVAITAGGQPAETLIAQVLPLADACRFLERNAGNILAPCALGGRGRPLWLRSVHSEIVREPFGVVLIIAPANYPLFLPGVQLFQALAAGNAVLLKPGPHGHKAASALREICLAAGIDERLVAVLPSNEVASRDALGLPVQKVFFTGSSEVGKEVLASLAERAIPAVVELSGCDAAIIRADADVEVAAQALAFGLRFNNSATCIAPRRVFVARRCFEQLEAQLVARVHAAAGRTTDVRLITVISESLAAGATPLIGGFNPDATLQLPCVLTDVRAAMPVTQLDTFAPVLSLIPVDSDEEAIAAANSCGFALGASVFSRDELAARALAARLEAGIVTINDLIVPTADPRIPFGGRKQSGFGMTRGAEGLLELTRPKVIQVRRGKKRMHFDHRLTNSSTALFAAFTRLLHGRGLANRFGALAAILKGIRR
jgi:acyl-CoA reductase-like NAD-dependent aldehyde dehydrogenase